MEKRTIFFLQPLKEWFRLNYKTGLLSFLIACVTFPKHNLDYGSGIDESLVWVFNYFADGHYALSQNLQFPHGRFDFLLYPLPMGNNLVIAMMVTCFCSMVFSMNMFRIFILRRKKNILTATLLLLVIHSLIDLQLLLIGITFSYFMLYKLSGKLTNCYLAVFFAVFAIYVKSYCGIICATIIFSGAVSMFFEDKNIKRVTGLLLLYVAVFVTFWIALYHSTAGCLTFFAGQVQLSSDNSEAVGLYNLESWYLLDICIVSFLLLPVLSRDKLARSFFMLMLLAIFSAWKHGIARSDNIHLSGLLGFLIFFTFSFLMITKDSGARIISLIIITITTFILNVAANNMVLVKDITVLKPNNLYDLVFHYNYVADEKNRSSQNNIAGLTLPDTILKKTGKASTDVYPWNYAIIAANHLNWQPRPVLQSYAAYTSWLDGQNAKHLLSENAASFFIWEINKTPAMGIPKMKSIDQRYFLNDEPKTLISFFSRYALCYKDSNYLVYEKRPEKLTVTSDYSEPYFIKNDRWTNVPDCDPDCILRAKVEIHKNINGILKSFFYKGEGFEIVYEMEDKSYGSNRIVPKNAADGLWLYPFIQDPATDTQELKIKKFKIVCTDETMLDNEFKVQFEQIRFNYNTGPASFLQQAFRKNKRLAADTL